MKLAKYTWLLFIFMCAAKAFAGNSTELQRALETTMHNHKITDLSVSVIRSGKTVYISDLHIQTDGKLITGAGSTQFRIASISKIFTAQAILQLQEKGKLSLDDQISSYIPAVVDSKMSIRDLLTHYGGWKDRVWPEPFSNQNQFDNYFSKVLETNKNIQTGNYQYSDTGFNILGQIVANVSRLNYHAYIERNILQPAKMRNSGYYSGPEGIHPSVEPFKNGLIIPPEQRWPYDPQFFPSEGLISNVADLTRWAKLILAMNSKLLTKKSYQQMLAPRLATNVDKTQIGWGWFITERKGTNYVYHMGGIRGYESIVTMQPDIGNAIIILANSSDTPRWEIVDLIEDILKSNE